ncbi:MAG: hypothetical protein HY918_01895 [Candidatus Doudnabacteria bacterium]|nr:hypothetical protein [Candidatus Doudnabacteria bacterium]
MERYKINTVSRETELQIAQWAKAGYEHPLTEQYKHGPHLNKLHNGRYSANIVGFILVGKFGEPGTAHERLRKVQGRYWELLGLTEDQCAPLEDLAAFQDCNDIGTETIIHDLFNVLHLEAHVCGENEWSLTGDFLASGAVVILPVSEQAKEWLKLALEPRNFELRNVRVNNLLTGMDDCVEMRVCTNGAGDLAVFVDYQGVKQDALDLRLWWLTRMLNHFMSKRIAAIKRRDVA